MILIHDLKLTILFKYSKKSLSEIKKKNTCLIICLLYVYICYSLVVHLHIQLHILICGIYDQQI